MAAAAAGWALGEPWRRGSRGGERLAISGEARGRSSDREAAESRGRRGQLFATDDEGIGADRGCSTRLMLIIGAS